MSGTRRADSLARPGAPLAWRQISLACKRRRWESNPLGAALQAAAVPSGSSVKLSVLARNRTWSTTIAGSRADPAHSEDKQSRRLDSHQHEPAYEAGAFLSRATSAGPVLSTEYRVLEHEREDSNPVDQFWRLAALPGAHSCVISTRGIRWESNPCLLVHSQACRNRYTTETILGRRHRSGEAHVVNRGTPCG